MKVSNDTWKEVFKRDKGICQYCKANLLDSVSSYFSATVDHIISRSAGGNDETDNLVCCCPSCNSMLTKQKSLQTVPERREFIEKRLKKEEENLKWWREQVKL